MNTFFTVLAVLLGLAVLIVILLMEGSATLILKSQGDFRVILSVFGFRKTLVHEESEDQIIQRYANCRSPERALRRERRRLKRLRKQELKKQKKAQKKAEKKAEKKRLRQAAAPVATPNILDRVKMIASMIRTAYQLTKGNLKMDVRKMELRIAAGNAAKTAILYGAASSAVSGLFSWIDGNFAEVTKNPDTFHVIPDYISESSSADVDIRISVKLFKGLKIAIALVRAYQTEKGIAQEKANKRRKQNR